jgi:membrane fusion protein, multidrug efflux system
MAKKHKILFGLLFVCAALNACKAKNDAQPGPKEKPPAIVDYISVSSQPIELTQELSGRVTPFLISEVRPQISGIIKERRFVEGSRVNAGQSLYQIDAAVYNATLKSNSASREQALANQEAAKIKLTRLEELIKINAVSKQEVDDARASLRIANANVNLQSANLEGAQINLKYTNVLAPITGRIGKSNYTKGALVTANQTAPLTTIQDISKVYVDITQSSSDILRLKKMFAIGALNQPTNASVKLILADGTKYSQTGVLEFSDLTVDPSSGSVNLRALFPNYEGTLLPGMYVRAILSKGTINNGIQVPQSCVTIDEAGNASLFLVGADNKAQKTQIQLGEMIEDKWQIISGLKNGDKVIIPGAARLKNGAPIKPKPVENKNTPQIELQDNAQNQNKGK